MATDNTTPTNTPGLVSADALSQAFATALAPLQPKTRITIANRVARNPMNPENRPRKMERDFYQNFQKVDPQDLTQEEFELLPKLREGNFVSDNREGYLFEVIEVKRGTMRGIHLRYRNATQDQRMDLMVKAGADLASMLRACIADYEKQKVAARAKRKADED